MTKIKWLDWVIFGIVLMFCVLFFIGKSYGGDLCEPQKITFLFGSDEITVIDANDLDLGSAEILKALIYFDILNKSKIYGQKELKLELFKKLAPNLYKRHVEDVK